jgi:hypothetical protein
LPLILEPAALVSTSKGYIVEPFTLSVGEGSLKGSADLEEPLFAVEATMDRIPLRAFDFAGISDLTGMLEGTVHLEGGPDKEPGGDVVLKVHTLSLRRPQVEGFPPATLAVRGELKNGRLDSELTLSGMTDAAFKAGLDLPLKLSLLPLAWSVASKSKLYGRISGDVELSWVPTLFFLGDHRMEGLMEIGLTVGGTAGAPRITGSGEVREGIYENYQTGMVLKDVALTVGVNTPRVTVEKARATDGEEGVISAEGWIDLLPEKDFPFSTRVTMDQATLVRMDRAVAMGTGK